VKTVFLLTLCTGLALAQSAGRPEWKVPDDAASKPSPLSNKPELAAGGKKIFAKSCAVCHDAGEKQKGPHLASAVVQSETDGALFWKISNGNSRTGMPTFSSLPDAQRWQLVVYIRSLAAANQR
jgi:mono/diheme cytochrome c family protein